MFNHMKYVYEVYKERSFSKAAANLFISQPSLSATIKKVEAEIGSPIFDRSTNPIQLTDCGKKYIKTMEKIMELQESFAGQLDNIHELRTGKLRIGGCNLFASFILPPIIASFTSKYPGVRVSLYEAHTSLLEEELLNGTLDLVIDNFTFDESVFRKKIYYSEQLLLAVPKKIADAHPSEATSLSASDIIEGRHLQSNTVGVDLTVFQEEPFIFLRNHNDTRRRERKICENSGITPHVLLKLDQQITSYHVTNYGMGISFISDTVIIHEAPSPNIVYYKLEDPSAVRNIYFHYKKNKYLTRSMEEFLNTAYETLPKIRHCTQIDSDQWGESQN